LSDEKILLWLKRRDRQWIVEGVFWYEKLMMNDEEGR
jgi:hypothetical protein